MSEFDILAASAAGMEAQRAALDVAARNVAAAQTLPAGPFERLVPQFAVGAANEPGVSAPWSDVGHVDDSADFDPANDDAPGAAAVRFIGTRREAGAAVDAVTEMVAVLNAQRAYEANASVFDLGKRLAERTLEVGRP